MVTDLIINNKHDVFFHVIEFMLLAKFVQISCIKFILGRLRCLGTGTR